MEQRTKMSNKAPITLIIIIALMFGLKAVYDNPNLLKMKENKKENIEKTPDKCTIITDMKYKTMQNDGGSYNNIYYEIDFDKNEITKINETYSANLGDEPTNNEEIKYVRSLSDDEKKEFKNLINEIMDIEPIDSSNNYNPYTIKYNEKEKLIYNTDRIDRIEKLLDKIDNKNRKLLFKLTSNGLKCQSPILLVYSDNTYEYQELNQTKQEEEPKVGEYDYNINLVLSNMLEFEDDGEKYIIEDSDGVEHKFSKYTYLEDFLEKINIKIDVCA